MAEGPSLRAQVANLRSKATADLEAVFEHPLLQPLRHALAESLLLGGVPVELITPDLNLVAAVLLPAPLSCAPVAPRLNARCPTVTDPTDLPDSPGRGSGWGRGT